MFSRSNRYSKTPYHFNFFVRPIFQQYVTFGITVNQDFKSENRNFSEKSCFHVKLCTAGLMSIIYIYEPIFNFQVKNLNEPKNITLMYEIQNSCHTGTP